MKINKLYLTFAAGALSVVPVAAADATTSATPKAAPKAEVKQVAAPAEDIWSKLPDVVATVDGKPVTKQELAAYMLPDGKVPPKVTAEIVAKAAPEQTRMMIANRLCEEDFKARKPKVTREEARKIIMDEFNELSPQEKLMLEQMLKQQGKTVDQAVEEFLAAPDTLDNIAQEKFAKTVIFKNCEVTDAEAKKYYDDHIAEVPETVEASHILVMVKQGAPESEVKAAREKIERIAAEVKKNPAAFEEIAKKESDCPSGKQGGKLGAFVKGRRRMDPRFEAAAFALKQGEISDVVASGFGFHIIRCDAAPKKIPFEQLKDGVKQYLAKEKMKAAFDAYIDGLMKQHNVQILVKAPAETAPAAK